MNGIFFRLHMIHRFWRFRLRKERLELACIRRLDLTGATVFDVGANKGVYCYWLSRAVGRQGRVFAFEPQPELQPHLAKVKNDFRLDNVRIVAMALSDAPGEAALFRDYSGAGHASFEDTGKRSETVGVLKTTMDSFANEHDLDDIAFMKLDVEGHELNALKGGEGLLRRSRPLLLLECHRNKAEGGELFGFLKGIEYDGFLFSEAGISHYSDPGPLRESGRRCSYLFGPADFIAAHGARIAGIAWR